MARLSIKKACERLLEQNEILILCHRYPDGDTIGSAFALCRALLKLGKRASVQCGDILPPKFNYMFEGIEPLKLSANAFIVAVDVADTPLLGLLEKEYKGRISLCIDHHPSNTFYADDTLLDSQAAAVGEIIYRMLPDLGAELTPDIALCLYTAISTDTGCFRFSNVTARTHSIAAKLLGAGIDSYEVNRVMFETKSKARMQIEKEMLESVDYRMDGRLAMMTITEDMIMRANAGEGDLDGLSNIPRCIEGVLAGVLLRETANGVKVSVRTVPGLSASDMCVRLGGGGHAAAAGCTIKGTIEMAKDMILESFQTLLANRR